MPPRLETLRILRAMLTGSALIVLALPAGGVVTVETFDAGALSLTRFDLNGNGIAEDGPPETDLEEVFGPSPLTATAAAGRAKATATEQATVSVTGTGATISSRGTCRSEVPIRGDPTKDGINVARSNVGKPFNVVLTEPGSFNLTGAVSTAPTPRRSENFFPPFARVNFNETRIFVSSADPDARASFEDAEAVGGGRVTVRGSGLLEPGSYSVFGDCETSSPRNLGGSFDGPVGEASWQFTLTVSEGVCNGSAVRWVGGSAGAFDDPTSWSPPLVPGVTPAACDLALYRGGGAIDVDLSALSTARDPRVPGNRSVGRLEVRQHAQVSYRSGTVNVTSPTLVPPPVLVENAELIVEPDGVLNASGDTQIAEDSILEVSGSFTAGTLRVGGQSALAPAFTVTTGGFATTGRAFLGDGGVGVALVGGAGSTWTTGALSVGSAGGSRPSILKITSGGIGLTTLADAEIGQTGPGSVVVEGKSASSGAPSSWLVGGNVTIGPRGAVEVSGGAEAEFEAANLDGKLTVSGAGSKLDVNDALVVQGGGSGGRLRVNADADVTVANRLTVGVGGPVSSLVEIRNGTLVSGDAQIGNFGGRGILAISEDGSLGTLSNAEVGTAPGSVGLVALEITQPTDDPIWLVGGNLIVGSDGGSGIGAIDLEGGLVEARGSEGIRIRANGQVAGSGTLRGRVENAGNVEGTFLVDGNYVQLPGGSVQGAITSPPPSPLLNSPAGALRRFARRPAPAPEPPPQGPIIVTGDATLDGTLVLQFLNGFAPRAGDSFDLIEVAGAVTGGFANVLVRGLAPGAEPAPDLAAGKLSLTFPEARVALPTVSLQAKPTLKETKKKGGKVKFTRAGDTSQPLLVSYAVGGLASNGLDYVELPGTLEIPAGKKSATLLVKPFSDGIEEEPETIELELLPGDDYAPSLFSKVTIEVVDTKR